MELGLSSNSRDGKRARRSGQIVVGSAPGTSWREQIRQVGRTALGLDRSWTNGGQQDQLAEEEHVNLTTSWNCWVILRSQTGRERLFHSIHGLCRVPLRSRRPPGNTRSISSARCRTQHFGPGFRGNRSVFVQDQESPIRRPAANHNASVLRLRAFREWLGTGAVPQNPWVKSPSLLSNGC